MILSFSTKFPDGQPTYFVRKIWECLHTDFKKFDELSLKFLNGYKEKAGIDFDSTICAVLPKRHTIRKDSHNRWKPGSLIHFIVFPRTKRMFQFAPVLVCKSVQMIKIEYLFALRTHPLLPPPISIEVDERTIDSNELEILAKNDGFDSVDDFLGWFDTDFEGKIIHWTDLRY